MTVCQMQSRNTPKTLAAAEKKLGEVMDRKWFWENYYTEDFSQPHKPIVGCGIIRIELNEDESEYFVTVRTVDGNEIDTLPDRLFKTFDDAVRARQLDG